MSKVGHHPATRAVFDVHTPYVEKDLQHDRQIPIDIISKSKIDRAKNPSLASKTIKPKAKSQSLWKVAGVVMLAVSSIFLWQFFQSPQSIQDSVTLNPFADPICLKTRFENMCKIDEDLEKIATENPEVSFIDPFNPICPDVSKNLGPMCFDENDIEKIALEKINFDHDTIGPVTIEIETRDKNAIENLSRRPYWDDILLQNQFAKDLSQITKDFITQGKYDEAFLVTNKIGHRIFFSGIEIEELFNLFRLIAQNSQTPAIKLIALGKLKYIKESSFISEQLGKTCLDIAQNLHERGYVYESFEALKIGCSLGYYKPFNGFEFCGLVEKLKLPTYIKMTEKLLRKGEISSAFKVLDKTFHDEFASIQMGYKIKEYDLDYIKGTETLYESLETILEEFIAKKNYVQANRILDRLFAPTADNEKKYFLWNQEKIAALISLKKPSRSFYAKIPKTISDFIFQ